MTRLSRTHLASQSGQAAVEYALVLPLVLLFVVLMVQLAFVFQFWIDTTHLASSGARYATVNHVPNSQTLANYLAGKADVKPAAAGEINSFKPQDPLQVCYRVGANGLKVGEPITIQVSDRYQFGSLLRGVGLSGLTVRSSATERLESVPDASILPPVCT